MNSPLSQALSQQYPFFRNERQALVYITLLKWGSLGVTHLSQKTGLHREVIQRELKRMVATGTVSLSQKGRNKKAQAVSLYALTELLESKRENFEQLLKPLLEAEAGTKKSTVASVYAGTAAFGILQMKMIRLQPLHSTVRVLSVRPKEWVRAMVGARKLERFERQRLQRQVRLELLCYSELRGQVEENNRTYFWNQPEELKRKIKYVDTELSSPLQIQIWESAVVMSVFDASPSLHILINSTAAVRAMASYFKVLWSLP